jgi:hypothetical protein
MELYAVTVPTYKPLIYIEIKLWGALLLFDRPICGTSVRRLRPDNETLSL